MNLFFFHAKGACTELRFLSHTLCRFLLCNQATLSPAQRVPYRQLSLPVSSQPGEGSTGGTSGRRDTGSTEGGAEPMLAETTGGDRPKMTKVISSEDEVARLTIEVTNF